MSHTPTPWDFKRAKHPVDGQFDYAISSTANPGCIAECFGRVGESRIEDASANAALIIRAVNCHDDLVKALELATHFISNGIEFGFIRMPENDPSNGTVARIQAALSKAKAQP